MCYVKVGYFIVNVYKVLVFCYYCVLGVWVIVNGCIGSDFM